MRIALIHNFYRSTAPSGEDIVVREEQRLLESRGNEIVGYFARSDELDGRPLATAVAALGLGFRPDMFVKLVRLLRAERPSVVHVHNTFPMLSPAVFWACARVGVPVVNTIHNYRWLCPAGTFMREGRVCEECVTDGLQRSLVHGCYHESRLQTAPVAAMLQLNRWLDTAREKVTRFIALTEFARRKLIEGGLPADRIRVKPNFLSNPPAARLESDDGRVVFVGRLSAEKGLRVLMDAWDTLPDVPLRIIGSGPMEPAVRQWAAGRANVELTGILGSEEALRAILDARLLVMPSLWYEGFPLTLREALACGTPAIASDLGSMAEIIQHDRTGLLVPPGDATALARAVREAYFDDALLRRLGVAARADFEEKYTADVNYAQLMRIYEEAIADA